MRIELSLSSICDFGLVNSITKFNDGGEKDGAT